MTSEDLEAKVMAVAPQVVLFARALLAALLVAGVIVVTPATVGAFLVAFEAFVGIPLRWLTARATAKAADALAEATA